MNIQIVGTSDQLLSASRDPGITEIQLATNLASVPSVALRPGQTLRSAPGQRYAISFQSGSDGLCLSSNNTVSNLVLLASFDRRVLFNDDTVRELGTLSLNDLTVIGHVQMLARNQIRAGHMQVRGLDILAADARGALDRPHDYGVFVLQGAFTLWNMQPDPAVIITADLRALSAGRPGQPVLGSGIFVAGAGNNGGTLHVSQLETGAIYSDGKIAPGTPDQISGGVFTVYGVSVDVVRNLGPVTTYGANDMALDNWGSVDRWIAYEKITTHGPSGIGFVNFGTLGLLQVEAPIETFGTGARGFNVYTGSVAIAEFDRIVTHGDGAVGVQIAQPVRKLIVHRGLETFGATGPSLVKGVLQNLSAIALSIKPGGSVQEITIDGGLRTNAEGIAPLEQDGLIGSLQISGGFSATFLP